MLTFRISCVTWTSMFRRHRGLLCESREAHAAWPAGLGFRDLFPALRSCFPILFTQVCVFLKVISTHVLGLAAT